MCSRWFWHLHSNICIVNKRHCDSFNIGKIEISKAMETEKFEVEQILKKRNSKNKASQKQLLFNTLSYSVFSTKCRNGI